MLRRQEAGPRQPAHARCCPGSARRSPAGSYSPCPGRRKSRRPSKDAWRRCCRNETGCGAGVCVGLNVYIELMTQMSSIDRGDVGQQFAASRCRRWPSCLNSNGEGSRPPVTRSVRRSTESGRWPWYFSSAGLGSNMSSCEGPPAHEEDDVVLRLRREIAGSVVAQRAACRLLSAKHAQQPDRPQAARQAD